MGVGANSDPFSPGGGSAGLTRRLAAKHRLRRVNPLIFGHVHGHQDISRRVSW